MPDHDDQVAAVKHAFDMIGTAATLLGAFPYAEAAASLRRQKDAAYYINPTVIIGAGAFEDLNRKIRLLDAAAAFAREWDAVKAEALAAEAEATADLGAKGGGDG